MLNKNVYAGLCLAVLTLVASSSFAQERTAAGAVDTQVTWTALSDMSKAAANKADAVNVRVDQVVVCGKLGKTYAPGAAGADASGCVNPYVDMTAINNMLACNKAGSFFNGTTCSAPIVNKSAAAYTTIVMATGGTGGGTSTAVVDCPAGYVRTGCSGARNPEIVDTCDESKCGLIGAGPFGERSCRAVVDGDSGTRATVWATCVKVDVN